MASFLGASTPAFAAEILGNHLSLSLAARFSSSTPAAFKPMAMKKKAKPVAITLTSKEQRFQNNHGLDSGIFLPNGDRNDIPERLDDDGEVPDKYRGAAGFIVHKVREVDKAFNKIINQRLAKIKQIIRDELEASLSSEPAAGWSSDWILDSGATCHACLNKKWFDTFEETFGEGFLMGDNKVCIVTGVGTVKVKMFDGIVRTLSDVRYVPALSKNVISLGRLDRLGYGFESSGGELKVKKGSKVYMKGDLRFSKTYRLQGVIMVGGAEVSTQEDSKDTTHTTPIKDFGRSGVGRKSKRFMKKQSKNVRQQFSESQ